MATERVEGTPLMTLADLERGLEERERMIEANKSLVACGMEPMFVPTDTPACPWPRLRTVDCTAEHACLVLLIEPQQEVRVAMTLKSYRIGHYLPLVPHVTTRGVRRTKVTAYRPMMRGYLFVHQDACEELELLNMRRPLPIHGFLRFGTQIATVSQDELRKIGNIEEQLAKPKRVQSIWDVGEVARIGDGAFWGLNATIIDLADGERIRVEIALLGRSVPMSIQSALLEKL